MKLLKQPVHISGKIISGAGRGKALGIPTLNLAIENVPSELKPGVYAARVFLPHDATNAFMGAVHFGKRPVFHDSATLEVHVIDADITQPPLSLSMDIVARVRDIRDFPDVDALKSAILQDIADIRISFRSHDQAA